MKRLLVVLSVSTLVLGCSKKDERSKETSEGVTSTPESESKTPGVDNVPTAAASKKVATRSAVPEEALVEGEATPEQGLAAAQAGAKALGTTLKGRLMSAMQESGPEGALEACAGEAQSLTNSVSTKRLRVGRSTLRLRNPKNAESPDWVKAWLEETGERKAEGVSGVSEVVEGTARVLVPLEVGGVCLACHGNPASQSESMQALLASRYPDDKATGYEPGDLRGALWAEFDLQPPQ